MTKKPKVLFDAFHLTNALTGIRTYSVELFKGLEEFEQDDFDYIFAPNWEVVNKSRLLRGKLNIPKKILNHLLYFSWKQVVLPFIILFKRVDVIVTIDYMLPYIRFGAQGITVFHDTFYWELKQNYNPVWRRIFVFLVEKGLGPTPNIIATTNYIAQKIRAVISEDFQIKVVYQCPKKLEKKNHLKGSLKALGLDGNKYFLHVGVFDERKNLEVLVRGFHFLHSKHPHEDFKLVLAGSPAVTFFHDSHAKIIKLIKELNLKDQVLIPGFVSEDELYELYLNAYAYVFPSKEEGFGIPVLEAMNMNVPLIISNQAALQEVAGGAALSFEKSDAHELFQQMDKLKNADLRSELIEKGRTRIKQFNREKFSADFHQSILDYYHH